MVLYIVVPIHYIEKNSVNILQTFSFCVPWKAYKFGATQVRVNWLKFHFWVTYPFRKSFFWEMKGREWELGDIVLSKVRNIATVLASRLIMHSALKKSHACIDIQV